MSYPDELIERVALALASLRAVEYDAATSADCEAARTALDAANVAELVEAAKAVAEGWAWYRDDPVDRCSTVPGDAIDDLRAAIAKWEAPK